MYYVYTFEDGTVMKSKSPIPVFELLTLQDLHGDVKLDEIIEENLREVE